MIRCLASAFLLLALLSGCDTLSPEARVREKLMAAGLKPHMAACLAPKLVHKLSTDELKSLGRLAKLPGDHPGHMSITDLADRLQALNDPHIVDVVTRSGLTCAIEG